MSKDLLEYALVEGKETILFHIENMAALEKTANMTLNILITAGGASVAGAVKFLGNSEHGYLVLPLIVLAGYIFILCGFLVFRCLAGRESFSPANEPKNLYQPDHSLFSIQKVELENLQVRIEDTVARNAKTSKWLNGIRGLFFLSPLVFLLALWVSLLGA